MSPREIVLTNPIEVGGVLRTSIVIRPPTDDDFAAVRRLNVSRLNRGVRFLTRLVDVPRESLLDISPVDQRKLEAFLSEHGV